MSSETSQDRWEELKLLAARQSGFFTTHQALDLGYSYPNQTYHVKKGNWLRIYHGFIVFPGIPPISFLRSLSGASGPAVTPTRSWE